MLSLITYILSYLRSLKKHLLAENSVAFTELTDLIRPGVTSRQEVAQLFHALLSKFIRIS